MEETVNQEFTEEDPVDDVVSDMVELSKLIEVIADRAHTTGNDVLHGKVLAISRSLKALTKEDIRAISPIISQLEAENLLNL